TSAGPRRARSRRIGPSAPGVAHEARLRRSLGALSKEGGQEAPAPLPFWGLLHRGREALSELVDRLAARFPVALKPAHDRRFHCHWKPKPPLRLVQRDRRTR